MLNLAIAGFSFGDTVGDNLIPIALGIFGIILSMIYVFATCEISGSKDILMGIFISLTQGILVAGCSVYFNQIYKQIKEE